MMALSASEWGIILVLSAFALIIVVGIISCFCASDGDGNNRVVTNHHNVDSQSVYPNVRQVNQNKQQQLLDGSVITWEAQYNEEKDEADITLTLEKDGHNKIKSLFQGSDAGSTDGNYEEENKLIKYLKKRDPISIEKDSTCFQVREKLKKILLDGENHNDPNIQSNYGHLSHRIKILKISYNSKTFELYHNRDDTLSFHGWFKATFVQTSGQTNSRP